MLNPSARMRVVSMQSLLVSSATSAFVNAMSCPPVELALTGPSWGSPGPPVSAQPFAGSIPCGATKIVLPFASSHSA